MPIMASQLVAAVTTSGIEESNRKLESVGKTSDSVGSRIGRELKLAAEVGGAALIGLGAHAVKMAGNFQESMTQLVTGAGESEKNLGLVSQGILDMSTQVGESTDQLNAGMYMIESSGQHGAQALQTLTDVAEGAKVGAADLGETANGVTTIMTDYANAHETAAQATNDLIATVAQGKTHMGELSAAMSSILPTAAAMHIKLTDVSGAMATMTAEGAPAADAATYLRQLLLALEAPGSGAVKTLKEIGLTSKEVANEMKISLPDTLQLITDHLKKKFPEGSAAYVDALKNIAGGSKQMEGILMLTGDHLKVFRDDVGNISDAVKTGGNNITGWAKVQDDFNQKMGQAHAVVDKFFIQVGTALLPALGKLGDWFVKTGQPVLEKFSDWVVKVALPNLLKFGDWFLKVAVPNLQSMADVVMKNLLPPVESLITNVVSLGVHIGEWLQNSGALRDAIATVSGVLGTLVGWVADFVGWLDQGNPLAWILVGAIGGIALAIEGVKLADWIYGWKSLGDTFKDLAQNLMPNYTASLKNTTKAADETKDSVKAIATETTTTREVVTTETALMEGDIAAVGTTAEVTAGEEGIGAIGAAASSAEGEVGTAATGMTGAFAGIAGSLGIGLVIAALGLVIAKLPDMAQALDDVSNTMIAKAPDVETAFNTTFQKTKGDIISAMEAASKQVNIDQKGMADEAEKQAKRMDDAWSHASQDMNIHDLLASAGWTPNQIAKYTGSTAYSDMPNPTVHRHAAGTSFAPGGLSLLGEGKEPEIVMGPTVGNLARGSQVIPFSQLRGGGSGGGGSRQEVHVHMYVGGHHVAEAILPDLAHALRQGLGTIGV